MVIVTQWDRGWVPFSGGLPLAMSPSTSLPVSPTLSKSTLVTQIVVSGSGSRETKDNRRWYDLGIKNCPAPCVECRLNTQIIPVLLQQKSRVTDEKDFFFKGIV